MECVSVLTAECGALVEVRILEQSDAGESAVHGPVEGQWLVVGSRGRGAGG